MNSENHMVDEYTDEIESYTDQLTETDSDTSAEEQSCSVDDFAAGLQERGIAFRALAEVERRQELEALLERIEKKYDNYAAACASAMINESICLARVISKPLGYDPVCIAEAYDAAVDRRMDAQEAMDKYINTLPPVIVAHADKMREHLVKCLNYVPIVPSGLMGWADFADNLSQEDTHKLIKLMECEDAKEKVPVNNKRRYITDYDYYDDYGDADIDIGARPW